MKSARGIVDAPRWAGFPTEIKNMAWSVGLEIKVEVDKHLLSETVRYEVTGRDDLVAAFQRAVAQSIEVYNARWEQ